MEAAYLPLAWERAGRREPGGGKGVGGREKFMRHPGDTRLTGVRPVGEKGLWLGRGRGRGQGKGGEGVRGETPTDSADEQLTGTRAVSKN